MLLCYNSCVHYFLHHLPRRASPGARDAFTLIELLVVIAIVAVLSVVVVLTLNPADLLRQSRDSNRLSDLNNINKAVNLFLTDTGGSGSLGTSTLTYLSLIDPSATTTAGTDCSSLGFAAGYFHCAASSTQRNADGTGWLPVNLVGMSAGSPLANLPTDPTNSSSSRFFYSYLPDQNGKFKVTAFPESQRYASQAGLNSNMFQSGNGLDARGGSGWVLVPGNSAFGTSNFWVMKYEAKCVTRGTTTGLTSPDTGYQTYSNSGTTCTAANDRTIASVADGYPIANISHTTASTYCASIGAHLLTNDEWMTIARNAESIDSDWTLGTVGSGALYSGHNDNVSTDGTGKAIPAGDDSDGYYKTGQSAGSNQRRTWTLSNGATVWDMPGNVYEHVARSVNNVGDLTTTMALPACSDGIAGWGWCDYTSAAPYVSAWSADVAQSKVAPSNSSWYASQGMGRVYTYKSGANQGTTVFLRGGYWSDGSNAGAFVLYLDWDTGNTSSGVGFRCAR